MDLDYLLSIGVNTGNSLDAVDVVLTKFGADGSIADLDALSAPMPSSLADCLRHFRGAVVDSCGNMDKAIDLYDKRAARDNLSIITADKLITEYTLYVGNAVKELINRFNKTAKLERQIDLIGFHGQTCAHKPPSISKEDHRAYTVQVGNGQLLANETSIPVVYDFRSDDLMNGGKAAPLAPIHHEHLALHLKSRDKFPIAFCNAGNTGNISVITERKDGSIIVLGWDVGPFNDYPDKLMQTERSAACDFGGAIGAKGKVNIDLLRLLFNSGAVTGQGTNYLLQSPPKSSDPQWYRLLPELLGKANIGTSPLLFEDRLRTAEYFAAYVFFYSLKWLSDELQIPTCFALCGGGWNNPISRGHFEQLLRGEFDHNPILPEHRDLFVKILQRLRNTVRQIEIAMSDEFGFSGQYMEARLFADAAVCRITGTPFSHPETTGCNSPTILGIIRWPNNNSELASKPLKDWLSHYKSIDNTLDNYPAFDPRWSRAADGWQTQSKNPQCTKF